MIRIAYDFEFIETTERNTVTVDPVSIGAVDVDNPDRTYYAILAGFNTDNLAGRPWLVANVLPHLPYAPGAIGGLVLNDDHPDAPLVKPRDQVADELVEFLLEGLMRTTYVGHGLELWADWGAYDHVCLTTVLGGMNHFPPGIPMFSHDVQQRAAELGVTGTLPAHRGREHHALDDGQWCASRVRHLDNVARAAHQIASADRL